MCIFLKLNEIIIIILVVNLLLLLLLLLLRKFYSRLRLQSHCFGRFFIFNMHFFRCLYADVNGPE